MRELCGMCVALLLRGGDAVARALKLWNLWHSAYGRRMFGASMLPRAPEMGSVSVTGQKSHGRSLRVNQYDVAQQ